MTLKPDTILQRVPGLELQLDSTLRVRITVNGKSAKYLEHSLAILNIFAQPTTLQAALKQLNARGTQDWMDLTGTINRLYRAGALVEPTDEILPDANVNSFGSASIHIAMLNDRARTDTFFAAINEVIKPGDIVVDIGTGTGVLAIAAARAGAARVYAIEAGKMAEAAEAVFAASPHAERLTLMRGWSTAVKLPELADVLVSEIIGRDPFEERVLQVTADARRRLLKPDARFVPHRVRVYGLAVTVPEDKVAAGSFSAAAIADWREWYDIDFTPLARMVRDATAPLVRVRSYQAAEWQFVSTPILLAEIDLTAFQETTIEQVVEAEITQAGIFNGVLMYFELDLGAQMLTSHPQHSSPASSWPNPVWLFRTARDVQPGDRFTLHYNYNASSNSSQIRLIP